MPTLNPTLLLTSCVHVSAPFVELSNPASRVELTLVSIGQWLRVADNLNIVICDGSDYDFTKDVTARFPGARIECLHFKNNTEAVITYGKGYGEGEIINFALEHSEYLRDSEYFIKCTSKLWVKNFPEIINRWNDAFQCQFVLQKPKSIRHAIPHILDTRFYIINTKFYLDHFSDAYKEVRDQDAQYLENCFRDVVLRKNFQASSILFPVPPQIEGVAGTSGETYKTTSPIKGRLKNLKTRLRLRLYERFFKPN